jgi:hypothetical protein
MYAHVLHLKTEDSNCGLGLYTSRPNIPGDFNAQINWTLVPSSFVQTRPHSEHFRARSAPRFWDLDGDLDHLLVILAPLIENYFV